MTIDHFIIYNPNSKGGNYKYAQHTAEALSKSGAKVSLILPTNTLEPLLKEYQVSSIKYQDKTNTNTQLPDSSITQESTVNCPLPTEDCQPKTDDRILITDTPRTANTLLKKLHFFWRILLNPIIFFFYLRKQPASNIIFNDFDQLTAIIWTPLFKLFKKKHNFSVILHDPDRDAYPGGIRHTNRSMKSIMGLMDIAFFHEQLPDKVYYNTFHGKKVSIPHGIYPPAPADSLLSNEIKQFKGDSPLLCIPGNIRLEKNYELIIEALKDLPACKLLIAGAPSSSIVKIKDLKTISQHHSVFNRIYWHTDYLSNEEFTSILEVSDLIILYYKISFTSQSGVLNQIAPLEKNVLISDTPSALTKLAKEFKLGTITTADNKEAFINGVNEALNDKLYKQHWDEYLEYASWEKQSTIIAGSFETLLI